jgi:hypothetical protein
MEEEVSMNISSYRHRLLRERKRIGAFGRRFGSGGLGGWLAVASIECEG